MSEKTGNKYRYTSFRNGGRFAGIGTSYDDYSEESGNKDYEKHNKVSFPLDKENTRNMNGPVIIVQKGKKNG